MVNRHLDYRNFEYIREGAKKNSALTPKLPNLFKKSQCVNKTTGRRELKVKDGFYLSTNQPSALCKFAIQCGRSLAKENLIWEKFKISCKNIHPNNEVSK